MIFIQRSLICLFILLAVPVRGQYTKEFKRIFFDAETLYLTGFYEEAYNRYRNLLTLDPENSNILFHCGASSLNIPGSEERAITYLKEAVGGVTPDYKERSHKEPGAPVLTYYMLGRAYHLHNEFEKAMENYEQYLEMGDEEEPLQREYTRLQIEACKRAQKVVGASPKFEFYDVLDQFDEDLPSCTRPVISGDGSILIFLVDYPSDRKIMMSVRSDSIWSRPRVINSEIGMVGETYPACLSYDGRDLYLVHQFYSHSDIFLSHFENGRWTSARELGSPINGRTSEPHASISRDGNTLYFTSDARGGEGSFDIYLTRKDAKGEWGTPENLGPVINTPYEEHTPFISANDSVLFFSSQGHASIGGIDVFYTLLGDDGTWGEPVNIGHPVNTTGEDIFFNPGWDEQEGYYAVRREDDPTSNTINMVIELEPEEEEVLASGDTASAPATPATPATALGSAALSSPAGPPDSGRPLASQPDSGQPAGDQPVRDQAVRDQPVRDQGVRDQPVSETLTIEKAIEPAETDEIEQVLNRTSTAAAAEELPEESPPAVPLMAPEALLFSIPFGENSCELNLEALLETEKIAALMNGNPGTVIELTGHADARGTSEYNLILSLQRAEEVAFYLEKKGVDPGRISMKGKGESVPVALNRYPDGRDAPLGRYLNRQVAVRLSGEIPPCTDLTGVFVPPDLRTDNTHPPGQDGSILLSGYTVQVKAAVVPVPGSELRGLKEVREHVCTDGYYRYTVGEYPTYREAMDQLGALRSQGFSDAFLRTLEWYRRARGE